jgi:hypothetical protein
MAAEVKIVGGNNNTAVKVTGQEELVVTLYNNGEPISDSNPLPTESTGSSINILLQEIIDQNSGTVTNGIISPTLPYSIPADTYRSYTIITTGDVSIDGVSVSAGSYSWSGSGDEKSSDKEITGTGSVIILTQTKS